MTLLSQRGTLRRGGAPAVSDTAPVPASLGQLWVDTSVAATALSRAEAAAAYVSVNEAPLTPEHYGAVGDGVADDTVPLANMLAAFPASGGGAVLTRQYKYGTTLSLPSLAEILCVGRLIYTGGTDAVKVANKKNVKWRGGQIDVSAAGGSAVGVHLAGAWFTIWEALKIVQGPAGSTGVLIETSNAGGDNWGSYVNRLVDLDLQTGAGAYGIHTKQTVGDTYQNTHLAIDGGWIANKGYGAYLDNLATGGLKDTVLDTGANDGLFVTNSSDLVLSPGEISGFTGWGINFGAGNSALSVLLPSRVAPGGTAGFMNTATYTPNIIGPYLLQMFASRTDPDYYYKIQSLFSYGKSLSVAAKGGGAEQEIITFGDAAGLGLDAAFGVMVSKLASHGVGFYGTTPVTKQTVTGAKGGNAALTSLMAALSALGIITDTTT